MEPRIAVAMQCSDDGKSCVSPVEYLRFLQDAGARTLLVEPALSLGAFKELMAGCQGFLVPGGNDIDPARYGQQRLCTLDDPVPQRDAFELEAVRWVAGEGIPYLGICRGAQVLNVALGGTLLQRIEPRGIEHWPSDDFALLAHEVLPVEGSLLALIAGPGPIMVNSLHHQAIGALGRGIVVEGAAPDGVVEAVRVAGHPFALGVQWHPEGMPCADASRKLAAAFMHACSAQTR